MKTIDKKFLKEHTKEERQGHLDLASPCLERGGNSTNHKGVLAQYLACSIPKGRVLLCHACHNAKCSNPKHLYWGSDKENVQDSKENGKWKSPYERTIEKYGEDWVKNKAKENGFLYGHLGGRANKGKAKTKEHKEKIANGLKRA